MILAPREDPLSRCGPRRRQSLRALVLIAGVLAAFVSCGAGAAAAPPPASWRFAPAIAPPSPPGVPPAPYAVPLGKVGQISFWAPNRGLLITGGDARGPVPAGIYAYDGVEWHQLATVCGGGEGRIAWAGPDEFWTISDQRPGQVTERGTGGGSQLEAVSLCHFLDGQVVGSYAMPLEQPESYRRMDAAACLSPADCWFAGETGTGPTGALGSFHLHWDGSTLTAIYDPSDHAVASMVPFAGKLFEGLAIAPEDLYLTGESAAAPTVIRTIAPAGRTQPCGEPLAQLCNLFLFGEGTQLPRYGKGVPPYALGGLELATDGSPLGARATQLWGVASPSQRTATSSPARVTVLHDEGGTWSQLPPLEPAAIPQNEARAIAAIAPEPGEAGAGKPAAWLALESHSGDARLEQIDSTGAVTEEDTLPTPQQQSELHLGLLGSSGPLTCPAPRDCWMATGGPQYPGWLFHLTNGATYPRDTDPSFAGLITYRPADAGVPVLPPDEPPPDDSLANQAPAPVTQSPPPPARLHPKAASGPLLTNVRSSFAHHRILTISFTLTARAKVRLIARRHRRVVATTRTQRLRPGRHRLTLALDPARWPTSIQLHVSPGPAAAPSAGATTSEGETIST